MYDFAFWGKAIEKKLTNSMKIHVFRMIEFFFEDIFGAAILFTGLYLYKYSTIPYFFAVFQQSNGIFLRRSKGLFRNSLASHESSKKPLKSRYFIDEWNTMLVKKKGKLTFSLKIENECSTCPIKFLWVKLTYFLSQQTFSHVHTTKIDFWGKS